MKEKPPTLYACIDILDTAVQLGLIQKDPNNKDNILVYFNASEDGSFKEGWYSCNLMGQAEELLRDKEGQNFLLDAIRKEKPEYIPQIMPDFFMDEYQGNGKLYILTGMSASGKDTALREMVDNQNIQRMISATTRPMRDGEIDGVDYNFMSQEKFEKGIEQGAFLEYRSYETSVEGQAATWYYGSLKQELSPYKDYVIVLDMQGAKDFVDFYGKEDCFVVNIQADDSVRESRAMSRGSFDKTEWDRRLKDDKVKFSDDVINAVANFVAVNENGGIDSVVNDIILASREYFSAMEQNPDRNIVIAYGNDTEKLFKIIDRAEMLRQTNKKQSIPKTNVDR